jgi:hypothetical protein
VSCNYDLSTPDLQTSFDGTESTKGLQKSIKSFSQSFMSLMKVPPGLQPAVICADEDIRFHLTRDNMERLGRFQARTVLSIGSDKAAQLYQDYTIKFALAVSVESHFMPY